MAGTPPFGTPSGNWAGAFDLLGELWVECGALRSNLWLENTPALQPCRGKVTFENSTTAGAVRLTGENGALIRTRLPGGGRFDPRLRVEQEPQYLEALDEALNVISRSPAPVEGGVLIIDRDPAVFAYRVK